MWELRRHSARSGPARLLAVGSAAAVLVLGVAACGGSDNGGGGSSGGSGASASGEKVTVGLIVKRESNPFFVKMIDAAKKAAAENNVELITAAGKTDVDNQSQVTALENMTTRGAKGILIVPADSKAVVPAIKKARDAGVTVIALDTPTEPQSAVDALFATDNLKAGELIGQWAKAKMAGKKAKIALLDLAPGISVGQLRHDGFLKGYGIKDGDPQIVGAVNTEGDTAKGQAGMEQLLQKDPNINLVYSINEPSGFGAATALKSAGKKPSDVTIVSVDGGCDAIKRGIKTGVIDATSQQYPQNMAAQGVKAIAAAARGGKKPSGYTDTGVNLITADAQTGVASKDAAYGTENCWG
ncbi:MAG: fructose transport system substrate-binding protein [Solirubrobacteraceae bacterium]|jgi:fructose transport system substrate-binding protein|nr:fructose transport system substrate-binding protein [Solirubrobacteraceae bacterium]